MEVWKGEKLFGKSRKACAWPFSPTNLPLRRAHSAAMGLTSRGLLNEHGPTLGFFLVTKQLLKV
jgi:hypothetical protein